MRRNSQPKPHPGAVTLKVEGRLHTHAHNGTGGILRWSLLATFAFVAVEAYAGIRAHSLALISDAGHNFTDALALLLAWVGYHYQSKPADDTRTYGYHRAGVLCAFVNALTLVALSLWIFYESFLRLRQPEQVNENLMIGVAAVAMLLNGGIVLALQSASRGDLNVRGAFIHMLGDALSSAGIVVGGYIIHRTGWQQIDPLLSFLIGALIIWTARDIIKESLNILLEGLPRGLTLKEVVRAMEEVEGVRAVHDLHIWSLGSNIHALSCHVVIADVPPSESDAILQRLNDVLGRRYHIRHTTMQFEHVSCSISGNGCVIPVEEDAGPHHHHHHH